MDAIQIAVVRPQRRVQRLNMQPTQLVIRGLPRQATVQRPTQPTDNPPAPRLMVPSTLRRQLKLPLRTVSTNNDATQAQSQSCWSNRQRPGRMLASTPKFVEDCSMRLAGVATGPEHQFHHRCVPNAKPNTPWQHSGGAATSSASLIARQVTDNVKRCASRIERSLATTQNPL